MAIIYTYPNLPLSSLSADDLLVITNVDATNNNPTKSVTLADIATYVTGTGSGTGTTNKIVKFTDGANGLLGDSIMTESTGLIDLAGQFVSTSSPTLTQAAPVSGIKAILNGTTAAPNVALYGESKHTGGTQADSNYGLFAKGEFEGTGGFTGFVIGGNLEGRYDGTGTNGANATVYGSYNLARATTAANGTVSYMVGANNLAKLEGTNVVATNLQATHSTVELSNGTAGDVIVQILDFDTTGGGTVTGDLSYLQIQNDTMPTVAGTSRAINSKSVLPSLFTGQVEIPLVPTINAHATSKQYVDQQISSVASGLVFQSTWDASSTPGGNPDLTAADKKVVGHYYVVSVAGSATPNGAGTLPNSWNVGDWCIYVEQGATDRWEKLDQTFVSGAGAAGQVTFWNSQNEVAGDNNFFWNNTSKRLGVGTNAPQVKLHVAGTGAPDIRIQDLDGTNQFISIGHNNGNTTYVSRNNTSFGTHVFYGADGSVTTERMRIDSAGDIFISPRATAASSGSGILYFKNIDDNSATINGGSIRTIDSTNNPSGADMRFQIANDNGTLFDAVTIDSNGFMGVGSTSPNYPLDIVGFANSNSGFRVTDGTIDNRISWSSGNVGFFGTISNHPIAFNTNSIERMRIDSSGNLGIGTTSPGEKLQVTSSSNPSIKIQDTTNGFAQKNTLFFNQNIVAGQTDVAKIYTELANGATASLDNPLKFATAQTSTLTMTDRMVIDNLGNVGIGIDDPVAKLHVYQNNSDDDTTAGVTIEQDGQGDAALSFLLTSVRRWRLGIDNNDLDKFKISSATNLSTNNKLTIDVDGNVGIGTTSPQSGGGSASWLSLNGTAAYSGGIVYTINSTTKAYSYFESDYLKQQAQSGFGHKFVVDGTNTALTIDSNGNATIGADTNAGYRLKVEGVGTVQLNNRTGSDGAVFAASKDGTIVGSITVTSSATAYNTSSDYRLKKDLKDFDGLDKVSKIPVYDFKWKVDDSSSYGVMAHELQDVLPDAVSGKKDGEEMQGVDYSKIVPLLIKSIQELEAKVKILENK